MELNDLSKTAAMKAKALDESRKQTKLAQDEFYAAEKALAAAISEQINNELAPHFMARVTLYHKKD